MKQLGLVALVSAVFLAPSNPTITQITPVYPVIAQAAEPVIGTERICLIPESGVPGDPAGVVIDCKDTDLNGIALFMLDQDETRFIVGYAEGTDGTLSGPSNTACVQPVGDCNGDCRVNVSDIVCVNIKIFQQP